jgi:hypothetical protein
MRRHLHHLAIVKNVIVAMININIIAALIYEVSDTNAAEVAIAAIAAYY